MLRSTSIKNDTWKPVKLLARQTVESQIISIDCDSKGDIAVVLSESELNIFTNRALSKSIAVTNGRDTIITSDSELIFLLLEKKIVCFDSWGQNQWEYTAEVFIDKMCVSEDGNNIVLSFGNQVISLNRFGEITLDHIFTSVILDLKISFLNEIIVATDKSILLSKNKKEFKTIISNIEVKEFFCSEDNLILKSKSEIFCISYNGVVLWKREITELSDLSFFDKGIKHVFLDNGKNVICEDRNGDLLWSYSSTDALNNLNCIESGEMFCFNSNNVFHVLDADGNQAWTHQARDKIVDFVFSDYGGDIIFASKYKIHWFQNEGFLRFESKNSLENAKLLIDKISFHESNIDYIRNDIAKAESLQLGNFNRLRDSFQILSNVNFRLTLLQKRHVEYLDSLPSFMAKLGLEGAQTDEMVPFLYPYFSLYRDLKEINYLEKLLETANYFLLKINKYDLSSVNDNQSQIKNTHFLKTAKKGILDEITNIENLIKGSNTDALSLETKLRELILDWLKTGEIESEIRTFTDDYYRSNDIRHLKHDLIKDKLDNHMAFVDYTEVDSLIDLESFSFDTAEKINLNLNLCNNSNEIIRELVLRVKLEGAGLNLFDPASGVIRFEHLNPNEKISPVFLLDPYDRSFCRIVMVVQYIDSAGRHHTNWLGEVESNFLGCYVKPLNINEEEHGDSRLIFKDFNSHSVINIEGLTVTRITNISKEIPGMHISNYKEESSRSIIYLSGASNLDDSIYLAMIFLRKVGGEESLRNVLELICHSNDLTRSSELRDEILSILKKKLLSANGRLV